MPATSTPRIVLVSVCTVGLALAGIGTTYAAQCVDVSNDPAGCQPSTRDTPIGEMPSVRVNRQGHVDPRSSEADARAGAAAVEEKLHLFRNFEHLHWVGRHPTS